jgi:hypothetical protein
MYDNVNIIFVGKEMWIFTACIFVAHDHQMFPAKSSVARVMISTLAFDRTPHAFRCRLRYSIRDRTQKMRSPSPVCLRQYRSSSHYK